MKIVYDGYNIALPQGTGVSTYGKNLCQAALALGHTVSVLFGKNFAEKKSDLLNEVNFFSQPQIPDHLTISQIVDRVKGYPSCLVGPACFDIPTAGHVIKEGARHGLEESVELVNSKDLYGRSIRYFRLSGDFTNMTLPAADVAHWTYPLPLRAKNAINVYTLHDLVPLRLPYATLDNKRKYLTLCQNIVKYADHIVTVSEASRQDIISILGANPNKVTNTYQSVCIPDSILQKSADTISQELNGIFGLEYKEYFVYYGAIEPKKNINRLIEAYLSTGSRTPLVIVGAPGWDKKSQLKLLNSIKALPLFKEGRLMQLEYLPLPLLMTVVKGAKALLFPSLYEGFGLPVLEAMTLGTPVLTSNTSSLPEIGGDSVLYVDPYKTESISSQIKQLDIDSGLRKNLAIMGIERARNFNAIAYQSRLSTLYQNIYG